MPFKNLNELPEEIVSIYPRDAQRVYVAAYNCAWEQYRSLYGEREEDSHGKMAHKVAVYAVERSFRRDDKTGTWIRRV